MHSIGHFLIRFPAVPRAPQMDAHFAQLILHTGIAIEQLNLPAVLGLGTTPPWRYA